ncbi:MAG: hypothetical protein ACWA5P_00045 [bacterium]
MKRIRLKALLLFSLIQTSVVASEWDFLSINGYGTLSVAYQNDDRLLYRNSFFADKGSQGDISFANYSVFGLQANAMIHEKLVATVQGVASENNANGKFIDLDWLNLKYTINNEFDLRVGIMRTPALMYSDILNVAYSYDLVHLPDMYGLVSVNKFKGAQLSHQLHMNDLSIYSSLWYGETSSDFKVIDQNGNVEVSNMKADDMSGLAFKLVYDNFSIRASYILSHVTIRNPQSDVTYAQFRALGIPSVTTAADKYEMNHKPVIYYNIGARQDFVDSYVQGEYIFVESNSMTPDIFSWNLSAGYTFGDWTPYLGYSNTDSCSNFSPISTTGLSAQTAAVINGVNQGLEKLTSGMQEMNVATSSLGLRYEILDNAALKFQYSEQKIAEEKLHIFSSSFNFVF